MSARWKVGLALLALSMAGQVQAGPPDPQAVIAERQLTGFMPPGWKKTLTASGLADVDTLLHRYSGSQPSEPPRAAALRAIAAALAPRPAPLTWSGRVWAWIRRSLLQPLERWLRPLGPELRSVRHPQAIFFAVFALLLAAAVAVLYFELRGSGLARSIGRAASQPRRRRVASGSTESARPPDPDWTLLRGQPVQVLRLLVTTLTRARRLEHDRHLTCRELETQARFETEGERAGFGQIARLAERELYGPPGITVLSDEILRDAQTLHARLLAAAGSGGAVPQ
ncbi:MAG TPA: hypothetical protein VMA54_07035 [Steroidobacteraceae bacterium]|nr:hypothetical protein [Steroidobacteraceae bacterium]